MKTDLLKAIQDYNKTIASLKGLHSLAMRANHPNRLSNRFVLVDFHPAAIDCFRRCMKLMYRDYKGCNLYYKQQLLHAALGKTSPYNSPSVWRI